MEERQSTLLEDMRTSRKCNSNAASTIVSKKTNGISTMTSNLTSQDHRAAAVFSKIPSFSFSEVTTKSWVP